MICSAGKISDPNFRGDILQKNKSLSTDGRELEFQTPVMRHIPLLIRKTHEKYDIGFALDQPLECA